MKKILLTITLLLCTTTVGFCSTYASTGSYYITSKNIGDMGITQFDKTGKTKAGNITIIRADDFSECNETSTQYCCWYSTATFCEDATSPNYGGCRRTVCTYNAAKALCQTLGPGWQLPDGNTMHDWDKKSKNLWHKGLQLCDEESNHGSFECLHTDTCKGKTNFGCAPYDIWAKDSYYWSLSKGRWSGPFLDTNHKWAHSVRCIKKK